MLVPSLRVFHGSCLSRQRCWVAVVRRPLSNLARNPSGTGAKAPKPRRTAPPPARTRRRPSSPTPSALTAKQRMPDHASDGGRLPPLPPSSPSSAPRRQPKSRKQDIELGRALSAAETAIRSAMTGQTKGRATRFDSILGVSPPSPPQGRKIPPNQDTRALEAQELRAQIAVAQRQLAELQGKLSQTGPEMLQRVSHGSHKIEEDEDVLAHVAKIFDKTPSAELAGRTSQASSDIPEDQEQFEAFANTRLQAAISQARQYSKETMSPFPLPTVEDTFVPASEAGYANDSPLERPLMYDVYRDKKPPRTVSETIDQSEAEERNLFQAKEDVPAAASLRGKMESRGQVVSNQVRVRHVDTPLQKEHLSSLGHGLDRVLFNPGVSWLQDPRTHIFNYNPRLRKVSDFDLVYRNKLPQRHSNLDRQVQELTSEVGSKFFGTSSALTGLLSHIYFLVMGWKAPDFSGFGQEFEALQALGGHTMGARLPAVIKLVYHPETGTYHVDEARTQDSAENYVLSSLGKSIKANLTATPEQIDQHARSASARHIEDHWQEPTASHFMQVGQILVRTPLFCQDPRLPRKTFDIKTRGVVAVRKDRENWVEGSGYQIRRLRGLLESYEREQFDLARSSMLKYLLEARMGDMDGAFVCYHNTATVFGFEYFSREQMSHILAGDEAFFEQVYRSLFPILEAIFTSATDHFPRQSLNLSLEARSDRLIAVVSQTEEHLAKRRLQHNGHGGEFKNTKDLKTRERRTNLLFEVCIDRWWDEKLIAGPLIDPKEEPCYTIDYAISPRTDLGEAAVNHLARTMSQACALVSATYLPTVDATNERERYIETVLAQNPKALERYLRERHESLANRNRKSPTARAQSPPSAHGQESVGSDHESQGSLEAESADRESWITAHSNEIHELRELSMKEAVEESQPLLKNTDQSSRLEMLQQPTDSLSSDQ